MDSKPSESRERRIPVCSFRFAGLVRSGWKRVAGLAAFLVLLRPDDACAYVDPSTGGYLLQMLLAGILAAAFAIRMFWGNLRLFFLRLFARSRTEETERDEPGP